MKRWLTVAAISVGVLLRCLGYSRNRSLWFDEAALAANVVERPLSGLLRPLDFHQGAPLGFLVVEKLFTALLGPGEYALRLFPLICGLLTMYVAAEVARRCATPGVVLATALVALNPALIYYSSEVKQYSSDALVTLLLFGAIARLTKSELSGRSIVGYGVLGALAVWCSHPAVFLLASGAIVLLVSARSDRRRMVRLVLAFSLWAASFLVLYLVSLRHLESDSALLGFWAPYFPPRSIGIRTLAWLFDQFASFFREPTGLAIVPGIFFCLLGWAALFKRNQTLAWIVIGAGVAVFLAAFAHRYPLGSRLLLFAVPVALLLVAEGVATLCPRLQMGKLLRAVVGCLILFLPARNAIRDGVHGVSGVQRDDIRPVLEYVNAHAAPSDILYVYFQAKPQMRYYSYVLGMREPWKLGYDCGSDSACYAREVDALAGANRVWVVFSHILVRGQTDDRAILLCQLDMKGRRLEEFSTHSAGVYLYDLSNPKREK